MKNLNLYIFESREVSTTSNKQRRKELEKWLKHKNYEDYVETLNKMLEDPKSAALLEDGFGGILGDTKLKFSVQKITVSQLIFFFNDTATTEIYTLSLQDALPF